MCDCMYIFLTKYLCTMCVTKQKSICALNYSHTCKTIHLTFLQIETCTRVGYDKKSAFDFGCCFSVY